MIDVQHNELPLSVPGAAARLLDLSHSRRLVYLGGEGDVLAAFLDQWHQLGGIWIGPADAQGAANRFLSERGLGAHMRYVAGDVLDAGSGGDLVVACAIDAAVERTLQLLMRVSHQWLPAGGRWLIILQRESPHPSSVVDEPMLYGQGLRVVSQWSLSHDVRMLVCAPARRILESLTEFTDRPAIGRGQ